MGTTRSFGGVAKMELVHEFDPALTEDQLGRIMGQLADYASEAGIVMSIMRRGSTAAFGFKHPGDFLVIREYLSQCEHTNRFQHTQKFLPPDPERQRTWRFVAEKALSEAGITYQLDEADGALVFTFGSHTAYSMFQALIDAGYVESKARALFRTQGPPSPGAFTD